MEYLEEIDGETILKEFLLLFYFYVVKTPPPHTLFMKV